MSGNKLEMILDIRTKGVKSLQENSKAIKEIASNGVESSTAIKIMTDNLRSLDRTLKSNNEKAKDASRSFNGLGDSSKKIKEMSDSASKASDSTEKLGEEARKTRLELNRVNGKKIGEISKDVDPVIKKLNMARVAAAGLVTAISAIAVGSIVSGIRKITDEVGSLQDTSDKTGIALSTLQGFKPVLGTMGVSVDGFASSLTKLNRTTTAASAYGVTNYAKMYSDLGIEFDKFSKLKPEEQFNKLADAVNQFDSNESRAILNRLGLTELELPIKNIGKLNLELERMQNSGLVVTDQMSQNILEFSDSVDLMKNDFSKFTTILYAEMLPGLKEILKLGDDSKDNELLNGDNAKDTAQVLVFVVSILKVLWETLLSIFASIGYGLATIINSIMWSIESIFAKITDIFEDIYYALENGKFVESIKNYFKNMYIDLLNGLNGMKKEFYGFFGKKYEFEVLANIKLDVSEDEIERQLKRAERDSKISNGSKRQGSLDSWVKESWGDTLKSTDNFMDVGRNYQNRKEIEKEAEEQLKITDGINKRSLDTRKKYQADMENLINEENRIKNKAIIGLNQEDIDREESMLRDVYKRRIDIMRKNNDSESEILDIQAKQVTELKRFSNETANVKTKLQGIVDSLNIDKKKFSLNIPVDVEINKDTIIQKYNEAIKEAFESNETDKWLNLISEKEGFESRLQNENKLKQYNDVNDIILETRARESLGEIDRKKASDVIIKQYKELLDIQKGFGENQITLLNTERKIQEELNSVIKYDEEYIAKLKSESTKKRNDEYSKIENKIDIIRLKEKNGDIENIESLEQIISLNKDLLRLREKDGSSEIEILKIKVRINDDLKTIENERLLSAKTELEKNEKSLNTIRELENQVLSIKKQKDELLIRENELNIKNIESNIEDAEIRKKALDIQKQIFELKKSENRLQDVEGSISSVKDRISKTSIFNSEKLNALNIELNDLTKEQLSLQDELNIKKEEVLESELFNTGDMEGFLDVFYNSSIDAFSSWVTGSKSAKEAFKDFASSTLQQILKMITQFIILKAIQSSMGIAGSLGGVASNVFSASSVPKNHNGGMIGDNQDLSGMKGLMSIKGLKDNEALRVLEKGEFVATEKQQQNISNALRNSNSGSNTQTTNVMIDERSLATSVTKSSEFGGAIDKYITKNKKSLSNILNS